MNTRIPRIEFEALPPSIAAALAAKVERLGYLGEFFARTAHQEAALAAFIDFTEASKEALDMRLVELLALTVACLKDVPYERNQHERLAVKLGFGEDWVRAVERLDPEHAELTETERAVQRYAIEAVRHHGHGAGIYLDALVERIGHRDAVAVMMVLARYVAHALMVNSMNIPAPVPSIFDDRPASPGSPSA
ncbi:MAG TPA: hypothetical protein VF210_08125 [Pseudomonadales bacterium]